MSKKPLCIVLGAGAGLGESLVQTFNETGYQVIAFNRSQSEVADHAETIEYLQLDLSKTEVTQQVLGDIVKKYGAPDVVVHNPASLTIKPFLETHASEYEACWQSMSLSLFNAMQALLPSMTLAGKGTVIVSGATASIRGGNKFSAFASAKFALRGLTQSLAREYQSQGIHIAHVLLDGIIDTERSRQLHSLDPLNMLKPKEVAQQYVNLVQQPESVWTHELDLRPSRESF